MKKLLKTVLSLFLVQCIPLSVFAVTYQHTSYTTVIESPSHLESKTKQIYNFDVQGLRKFIDKEVSKDTVLYRDLNEELKEMESAQNKKETIQAVSGVMLVGGLLSYGASYLSCPQNKFQKREVLSSGNVFERTDFEALDRCREPFEMVALIGLTSYLISIPLERYFSPSKNKLKEFINKNNQKNEGNPLEIKMGFWNSNSVNALVSYTF